MEEPIFNLFAYIYSEAVCEIGAVKHVVEGTEEEKTVYLKSRVSSDYPRAIRLRCLLLFCSRWTNPISPR